MNTKWISRTAYLVYVSNGESCGNIVDYSVFDNQSDAEQMMEFQNLAGNYAAIDPVPYYYKDNSKEN